MCSSSLDFRLGVLTVVGEESVSAALHQHGECDSDHLNVTVSLICRSSLIVQYLLTSIFMWIFTAGLLTHLCVQPICYGDCSVTLA